MIIRSQDKCKLVNCNDISMYQNNKLGKVVITPNDNPDLILGLYSSKDKGLKILDMMEELVDDFDMLLRRRVFHMPQDEEVLENDN